MTRKRARKAAMARRRVPDGRTPLGTIVMRALRKLMREGLSRAPLRQEQKT